MGKKLLIGLGVASVAFYASKKLSGKYLEKAASKLDDIVAEGQETALKYREYLLDYLDEDFLISAGNINVQLTWMDAKVEGVPVTPRNGKSVEINAMWYNAVKILKEFSIENNEIEFSKELNIIGSNIKTNFEKIFKKEKDGLKDTESSDKIRPNQLFAISLTYPVIEKEEIVKDILEIVEKKLLNRYGLKTLAKYEDGYIEKYFGDEKQRDRKLSSRNIMAMAFRIIL